MYDLTIKTNSKGFAVFDRDGRHRMTVSDQHAKIDSASVNINVSDPARITTNREQANPLGRYVASSIVSPQPTWTPIVPTINIAMTMIFAIAAIASEIEDDISDKSFGPFGKPIRRTSFQIVNFEDFLPESAAG